MSLGKSVSLWAHPAVQYASQFEIYPYRYGLLVLCCGITGCDWEPYESAQIVEPSAVTFGIEADDGSSRDKTIGLVLSNYYHLMDEDDETWCPTGFAYTNRDNWEAQFPTQAAQQEHLSRCLHYQNRGPNCENVWFSPDLTNDLLPFREGKGTVAYGVNLDGTEDGSATETTCTHEPFLSPEGEKGIDNQYYRFLRCDKGLHQYELLKRSFLSRSSQALRLLLEIKRNEKGRDDDSVEVAMYRGRDPLIVDAHGNAVPWQSQRIDEGPRQLIFRVPGRIVSGVLITEPTDVMWTGIVWEDRLLIRGMSLRLKLTPTGAEGLRVGYIDVQQFWQRYSRVAQTQGTIFGASGPSAHAALHRLADGYKDPQTGACTALSSAYEYEFVRAYIVHPSKEINP